MTSLEKLKREIEIVKKAVQPKLEHSDEVNQLLKQYEAIAQTMTVQEQHKSVQEIVYDLLEDESQKALQIYEKAEKEGRVKKRYEFKDGRKRLVSVALFGLTDEEKELQRRVDVMWEYKRGRPIH